MQMISFLFIFCYFSVTVADKLLYFSINYIGTVFDFANYSHFAMCCIYFGQL